MALNSIIFATKWLSLYHFIIYTTFVAFLSNVI